MNEYTKKFIVYWLPPLLWMVFIFPSNRCLTSDNTSYFLYPLIKLLFPYEDLFFIENIHKLIRKTMHFLNYAFLSFLLFRAFRMGRKVIQWKYLLYSGLIATVYGMVDETFQAFIPSRTGSVYDWLIDSAGVLFSMGVVYFAMRKNTGNPGRISIHQDYTQLKK